MRTALAWTIVLLFLSSFLQGDIIIPEVEDEPTEDVIITVDSTNLRFSPDTVSITEGDTVRFFWSGQALPHNAVESNEVFDSGEPARDVDYSFTFEIGMNGTYDFVCEPHAALGMVGQIIVEPGVAVENNNTNTTNQTNATEMEGGSLPFLSVAFTLSVLAMGACVHRGRDYGNRAN